MSSRFSEIFNIGVDGDISDEEFLVLGITHQASLANGIGTSGASLKTRNDVFSRYKQHGFRFTNIVARSAIVSTNLSGEGIQIFHNAYVGPNVKLGDNIILNTGAIVEHDSSIGDSAFVGPGAIICGGVTIGRNVFIGAGAIVLPDVKIPTNTVIPAGSRFPALGIKNHKL